MSRLWWEGPGSYCSFLIYFQTRTRTDHGRRPSLWAVQGKISGGIPSCSSLTNASHRRHSTAKRSIAAWREFVSRPCDIRLSVVYVLVHDRLDTNRSTRRSPIAHPQHVGPVPGETRSSWCDDAAQVQQLQVAVRLPRSTPPPRKPKASNSVRDRSGIPACGGRRHHLATGRLCPQKRGHKCICHRTKLSSHFSSTMNGLSTYWVAEI